MPHAIHAVYENGTFRPLDPVDLPEATEVIVTPLPAKRATPEVPWEQRREAWLARLDALRSTMKMPPPGALTTEQILDDDRGD